MKAIIMAGGKGSRLRPLTCNLPKPMVPLAGKPMMEHIVELLVKHGFQDIGVTVCYLPERIQEHFGDGRDFGVSMRYFTEDKPLGTAGSVRNAADFLTETFLVISGDALTDFDLEAAVNFHRARGAVATLVLTRVEVPLEYGVVVIAEDGAVQRFLEKPGWSQVFSDTVNTGIYVLEPEIFRYFQAGQEFDFAKDLFPILLAEGRPLYGYVAEGYWSDVGNLGVYRRTHIDVMDGKVRVNVPGEKVGDGIWVGGNVDIHPTARIDGPAIIGDNCRLGPGTVVGAYTCLGSNCVLGENATVKRSVFWNSVYVGQGSELRGSILATGVQLAGKVRAFEGSVIGDHSTVGPNSTLQPAVKIWPEKDIAGDAIVDSNVIWAPSVARSIFGSEGICGAANVEVTPETAAKAGSALGSVLPARAKVAIGADGTPSAQMLKRAFLSGLASTGVHGLDLGTATVPMVRFAAATHAGGVHIKQRHRDSGRVVIAIFDNKGFPFTRARQRSVEGQFYREEFRRVNHREVGRAIYEPGLATAYLNWLLQHFARAERQTGTRNGRTLTVAADAGTGAMSLLLSAFLRELGCRVIEVENYGSGLEEDSPTRLKLLQAAVRKAEADLGVLAHSDGTRAALVDDGGNLVPNELFWPLVAHVLVGLGRENLVVPVYASQAVEAFAREKHVNVKRPGDLEKVMVNADFFDGEEVSPDLYFDALAFLGGLIQVVLRKKPLSAVLEELPAGTYVVRSIRCPWEVKGKVMRSLIEETKDLPRELVDGVKVFHNEGWALVLPDDENPYVKLFCEAGDMEAADQLAALYEAKIAELRK